MSIRTFIFLETIIWIGLFISMERHIRDMQTRFHETTSIFSDVLDNVHEWRRYVENLVLHNLDISKGILDAEQIVNDMQKLTDERMERFERELNNLRKRPIDNSLHSLVNQLEKEYGADVIFRTYNENPVVAIELAITETNYREIKEWNNRYESCGDCPFDSYGKEFYICETCDHIVEKEED